MTKGERYRIYNHNIKGDKIYEGVATLVSFNKSDSHELEYWDVRFTEEIMLVSRLVNINDKHED